MTNLARIGIGTVQFGMDYGISNRGGRPDEREVAAILARAVVKSVGYIDTAANYAEAETLIGRHLPSGHSLRIVTKLPAIAAPRIEAQHGTKLLEALARSLDRLRASRVYGVLVHHAADLAKPGAEHIVDALLQARARGWTEKIGVSVYDAEQLALAEGRFQPQLVQLPFNVLDRRPLQSDMLSRLKARGVEVHARSVFLQGALLMNPDELPQFFAPVREHIARLQQDWNEAGLSVVSGCLGFVLQCPEIDAVMVGVNSVSEFDEIAAAIEQSGNVRPCEPIASIDPIYLDASRWPVFAH